MPALLNWRSLSGSACLIAFVSTIPLANWMIHNLGAFCVIDGPCLIQVAPNVLAPSGVLVAGLAFVLRDFIQRLLGATWALGAVVVGTVLAAFCAPISLALASGVAFLMSEAADFAIYSALRRRSWMLAVIGSSTVGIGLDSLVFLMLAFGNLDYLLGQIVGKLWALLAALPIVYLVSVSLNGASKRLPD